MLSLCLASGIFVWKHLFVFDVDSQLWSVFFQCECTAKEQHEHWAGPADVTHQQCACQLVWKATPISSSLHLLVCTIYDENSHGTCCTLMVNAHLPGLKSYSLSAYAPWVHLDIASEQTCKYRPCLWAEGLLLASAHTAWDMLAHAADFRCITLCCQLWCLACITLRLHLGMHVCASTRTLCIRIDEEHADCSIYAVEIRRCQPKLNLDIAQAYLVKGKFCTVCWVSLCIHIRPVLETTPLSSLHVF